MRPYVDAVGDGAAAMIQIDGSERVVLRENVRDPVSMLSLHGG